MVAAIGSCSACTFAQCRFLGEYQKYTTLVYTKDAAPVLDQLNGADFQCNHTHHKKVAGGRLPDGSWASEPAAAYPAQLIVCLAMAFTNVRTGSVLPLSTSIDARTIAPKAAPPALDQPQVVNKGVGPQTGPIDAPRPHQVPPVSPIRFNFDQSAPTPTPVASSQPQSVASSNTWLPARRICGTPNCTFADGHDGAHNFELADTSTRPRRQASRFMHSSDQLSGAERRSANTTSVLPAVPEGGGKRSRF